MMFAEFAPGLDESTVQVGLGLAFLVIGNAAISMRLVARIGERRTAAGDVAATCALNAPIVVSLMVAAQWVNVAIPGWSSVFLVLLASLLIGLRDRYHDTYRQLFAESRRPRGSQSAAASDQVRSRGEQRRFRTPQLVFGAQSMATARSM